jgi:DNA-binding MarR family transcriptional regulator
MGNEEDDIDGAALIWPMERLARLLRAQEHDRGLNPAQWEALRYLARANRFSNSPGGLTRYLGATKGTISQTVMALERKGLVTKALRDGEKRSVTLTLTPAGEEMLVHDPWAKLAKMAQELGGKTRRRTARGLRELLANQLKAGGQGSYGSCETCRFFREKGRSLDAQGPHLCMYFEQALRRDETGRICIAHAER